ncbi:hypothetical protein [Burkholderia sp. Bp8998]|uniref:hypothetical protein n=1 Tax=Burkholderia sp. Bp8998 TaxID=2184557 RepID=UPI000F575E08|nr:hypothetical protein [Burkholderia sp. Bp8998]RQR63878.1 hypothetical protein DIE18_07025 [Burkholderia sp. Bp9125]RQS17120.1 hypothetical protein DIE06_18235 [Burkholderia sp. Bp8998]
MKTIETYVTADGRQFTNYVEALRHEVTVVLPDNLAQIINDEYAKASCGVALQDEPLMKIVDGVINNLQQVEKILEQIKSGRLELDGLELVQQATERSQSQSILG